MDKTGVETVKFPSNPIAGLVRARREVFARTPPALFIRTPESSEIEGRIWAWRSVAAQGVGLVSGPAVLALEDGSIFRGQSIGANGTTTGEVVFNTALTGYQEILSDPSYSRQIVTLTYPHIGNVGTNADDMESARAYAAGLVVRDLPRLASNYRI